jgi:hypothetical protein
MADVDHFLPYALSQFGAVPNLHGVWNLVLACSDCNRGLRGKFARLPLLKYLMRLHTRNEFLINSHHPLRETLLHQTGLYERQRIAFLQSCYDAAQNLLIHSWEPAFEHPLAF